MSVDLKSRGVRFSPDSDPPLGSTYFDLSKTPQIMERQQPNERELEESGSSDESNRPTPLDPVESYESNYGDVTYTPASTIDNLTPTTGNSTFSSWSSGTQARQRANSGGPNGLEYIEQVPVSNGPHIRLQRPTAPIRTPSSTYAPPRRPSQFPITSNSFAHRQRSSSANRARRDPNAQYRAQEKAYIKRLKQDPTVNYVTGEPRTPSVGYSTDSETEDELLLSELQLEGDAYDQETLLYYNHDEALPSEEEMKIPANKERIQWYSMLEAVLKGDVVKQEKKRLIGTSEQMGTSSLKSEIWTGIRSKICGRSLAAQRRLIEDGRSKIDPVIESIIHFEIKGESEAGKSAVKQVQDVVDKIDHFQSLYPTRIALEAAHPRASSDAYTKSSDAIMAWHNTTRLINTELAVLQAWVGNEDLDFTKRNESQRQTAGLSEDAPFIERIMKEDGLKSLQGDRSMLLGVKRVTKKAKDTLIENASKFAERHLPPYIEELLILINFPSRLIQEIIRMRLSYARAMKDLSSQSSLIIDQMIAQFQILMRLAVVIKQEYISISQQQMGWDLPPCIDENFDQVIVEALKYYFKMINSKLVGNKNTFKEAEILESEWDFSNDIGRNLDGGDLEVAEQFSSLAAKALTRLATHFEKELTRREDESPSDMEKRYKQLLDSVRVRQRKLFRFSKILGSRFENAAEYSLNIKSRKIRDLCEALIESGHILIASGRRGEVETAVIASPSLENDPLAIRSIMSTCFHTDDTEDFTSCYVLIITPDQPLVWDGNRMDMDVTDIDFEIKQGKIRLIGDGPTLRLATAKNHFTQFLAQNHGIHLDVLLEQRANSPRINRELIRIKKTTYRLSTTIVESVEEIRKQTEGLGCQDLVQTCFSFATEFGQRSQIYMDPNRRALANLKLTHLALDWVSFICDDCIATDRKTFRWAVIALEYALARTRGQNLLALTEDEYARLRLKVSGCMSLLISHFDIMGARFNVAAQAEKERLDNMFGQYLKGQGNKITNDKEASEYVRSQWLEQLSQIDEVRRLREAERQALGKVLEESNEADRSLTTLSSSATNVTMRWQQGQFVGGGSFGSVYAAINLDSGYLMAVKEIRLQDPQLIPTIAHQIRDEMGVLEVLDHPNIVSYYGIEVHRDKVYIFMEYCSGGSLSGLLEHGRIEDETVIMVYALQMLEGLAYLHSSGIVHRDIKPENILLDHNGVIKYVDFGAAKIIARQGRTLAGDGTRKQNSMTGTPMYMSPEVIKGSSEGRQGALDVWSLGCVILEMATGKRPWATLDNEWAIMYNIAQGKPPQLPTQEQLSEAGIDFLRKCFDRDPSKRSTAAELLQHEWIMAIRSQVVMDPPTPSDSSSSRGSYSS